jgi:UDP-2,3-diacylglucosamine pyrophosphatase LpxH
MSPSHITEWATNVTMTYNAHSVICHGDICCSLSYMWWWHLLLTQLYVMVTFVAHSIICHGDMCCSLSYMWWWHLLLTRMTAHFFDLVQALQEKGGGVKLYLMVPTPPPWWNHANMQKCTHAGQMSPSHITEWAINVTMTYNWVQLYVIVTFVAHSVICHGDIFCSLSYMWWWHFCSLSYMWFWHLLLTQLYVIVTFVAHSVIWSPSHITEWATHVTMTYNWVSNKCHHDI